MLHALSPDGDALYGVKGSDCDYYSCWPGIFAGHIYVWVLNTLNCCQLFFDSHTLSNRHSQYSQYSQYRQT